MQYFLLFLEGVIAFISPCLLPMLPVYVSIFAAGQANGRTALINALGFVFGFTLLFVLMGAFAGTAGALVREYSAVVNIVSGSVVILLGLNFLGVIRIGFLNRTGQNRADTRHLNLFTATVFGIVMAVSWTPCTGAFLGSALLLASTRGDTLQGVLMLLLFSLGLGIPYLISALLIDQLKNVFDFIKRNYKTINLISGGLLILMGILMMTGLMWRLFSSLTFFTF